MTPSFFLRIYPKELRPIAVKVLRFDFPGVIALETISTGWAWNFLGYLNPLDFLHEPIYRYSFAPHTPPYAAILSESGLLMHLFLEDSLN